MYAALFISAFKLRLFILFSQQLSNK